MLAVIENSICDKPFGNRCARDINHFNPDTRLILHAFAFNRGQSEIRPIPKWPHSYRSMDFEFVRVVALLMKSARGMLPWSPLPLVRTLTAFASASLSPMIRT